MNTIYQKVNPFLILLCFGVLMLSSCGSTKKIVYFSNLDSTQVKQIPMAVYVPPVIVTDDILNITIQTLDVDATSALNQTSSAQGAAASAGAGNAGGAAAGASSSAISGFLVDHDGNVEIPLLGVVKVAGLNTTEAKNLIKSKAAKFYKDPTVQVRFGAYKITIMGEVAKPASYLLPNEKVTVLDAISLAGDVTVYGKLNNILLLRDDGDKKDVIRLDLTSSTLISSPYYYLKQNDVIYVEPIKVKAAVTNAARNQLITIGVAVATLLVTILR